jgi:hypothetical protein
MHTYLTYYLIGLCIAYITGVMANKNNQSGDEKMKNLKSKLAEARQYEADNWERNHKNCYVIWSVPMQCYLTQLTMPLLGEWYTSDGIQHGPTHIK